MPGRRPTQPRPSKEYIQLLKAAFSCDLGRIRRLVGQGDADEGHAQARRCVDAAALGPQAGDLGLTPLQVCEEHCTHGKRFFLHKATPCATCLSILLLPLAFRVPKLRFQPPLSTASYGPLQLQRMHASLHK